MSSHSDSEPDDDTITIAMKKVVISRVCGIGGASRTKQNNNKQEKQTIRTAMHDKHQKVSTIAEFGD